MKTAAFEQLPETRQDRRNRGIPTGEMVVEDQFRLIRNLIWLYLALWLIEGGLRRWFLPGLATPLLLVRDPAVIVIYIVAMSKNVFPANGFVLVGLILSLLTLASAMLVGHGNVIVALYGVRCDFLHVPLIFIMARVLRQKDVITVARVAAVISIPYTALLVDQFYSPQSAWVNRGVGGSLEGAGFAGALGRFRPPGTFSFISGPGILYPLFAACWFTLVLARKSPAWLMIASGVAILVAMPMSVSRVLFLGVVVVAVAGLGAMMVGGQFSAKMFFRGALAAMILPFLALQLPAFRDGMEAFGARWADSTTDNGGFKEAIVDRVLNDLFGAFGEAQLSGLGTGYSTNVGQQLLTEDVGFGASEGEWGRLLFDNGLILGSLLVIYRTALTGCLVLAALRALRRQQPASIVFLAACFLVVLNGQWGQATTLGAAAIGGGLVLAAAQEDEEDPATLQGVES
jgi:hypothetical protein